MNYQRLRNEVIQSSQHCSVETLNTLKDIFAERVDSARRLDNIVTLVDLLTILEKRNVQNLQCFNEILSVLNNTRSRCAPIQQSIGVVDNTYNRNTNDLNQPLRSVPRAVNAAPRVSNRKEIYDLICNELVLTWKIFARYLGFNESKIQQIEDGDKLISERVRKVLLLYESSLNGTNWSWRPLLEALSESRRNDLRDQIECTYNVN
ncbi:hypothetical protein RI129_007784 [Pyrocoelia pectoralis]|uniref:Death domain-containing protein n=1 Tax=Pyrocoelia pectoralis TaxID=417401 RepID=A0AAN7VIA8_9COLE